MASTRARETEQRAYREFLDKAERRVSAREFDAAANRWVRANQLAVNSEILEGSRRDYPDFSSRSRPRGLDPYPGPRRGPHGKRRTKTGRTASRAARRAGMR